LSGIDKYPISEIWQAIEKKRAGDDGEEVVSEGDIKRPEWEVLTLPSPPTDWPHFLSKKVDVPSKYTAVVDDVLLLERLREVNALIGYTRVEAPDDTMSEDERPPMADLTKGRPEWVPACEVHGEGIFIRFDEEAVLKWGKLPSVKRRSEILEAGHRGWRIARELDPNSGYPGIRYAMLHTLGHLLIRELALECGYNAASIRERIYSSDDEDAPMAGILIYTAAADSDGTLGGLVELGKPESLGRLLDQALFRSSICSSDPLCSEHDPGTDRSLHNAACHACTFVAETSCERGNRYLDRALLVETLECKDARFFTLEEHFVDSSRQKKKGMQPREETQEQNVTSLEHEDVVTCKLRDVASLIRPDRRIKILEAEGTIFRYPREDEEIHIEKGRTYVLSHHTLQKRGEFVPFAVGKVIDIRSLVDPETDQHSTQVTLKSAEGIIIFRLTEEEFTEFRPLCVVNVGI